jgi:hypothetical protein
VSGAPLPAVATALGKAQCWALVPTGAGGAPRPCNGEVAWTGLVLRGAEGPRPAEAWQAFACEQHGGRLAGRRRLLDRDRELLDAWRAEQARLAPGHPRPLSADDPFVPPEPLASGWAAVELVERARRWQAEHGDGG